METTPFVCGICAEKFEKIVNFYMHLGEHNVLIQKEFHVCDVEVSSKTKDISGRKKKSSNKMVKNEGKEDTASITASYICKACKCTFATLCLLHNHISRCFGSGSYVFDAEHNTAYPIKSICSFLEGRNDIPDIAEIRSNNSDCDTVDYGHYQCDPEVLENIENEDHSCEGGRNTEALNDVESLEGDSGKVRPCVKEESSDVNNTEKPNSDIVGENDKTDKSVTKKDVSVLVTENQYTQIKTRKGRKRILKESDVKQNKEIKTKKRKVKRPASKIKLEQISSDDESVESDAPKQKVKQKKVIKPKKRKVKRLLSSDDESVKSDGEGNKKTKKRKVKRQASEIKSELLSSDDESVKSDGEGNKKTLHTCGHCGKEFKWMERYKDHLISHTKERTHKCELCPRAFKYQKGLKQHMLTHSSELPYCCESCGERFPAPYLLNQHRMVKHVTEKPHKCGQCGAAFKRPYGLVRHAMQHSERQHQCEVCGMGFTRLDYLEQHRWTHDDKTARRFPCDQCDIRFFTNYQLQCHLKVHSGERPFSCKLCTAAFIQRKELRKHVKKRHGVNLEDLDIADGAEDNKAFQTGLVKPELPGEIVEDGIVYINMENQSNVYEGMDTQSMDYQMEETQSTVIINPSHAI